MIKEIDEFITSMNNLCSFNLDDIKKGQSSYLRKKYNLDIDDVEQRYCFRSEYDFEGFKCDNISLIKNVADTKFNQMVINNEMEYKDIEIYEIILNKVKKENVLCIECIKNHSNSCPIKTRETFLYNKRKRQIKQYLLI